MKCISLHARAKINLAIDVLRRRADGYHDIRSVMQTVTLSDSVYIKKIHKEGYLKVVSNLDYLPSDEKNLAYKAARMLIELFDIRDGVFICLTKRIPVSAGLAGGSADCAAVLIGMRRIFELPLAWGELLKLGAKLGADVPFCLMRGTALAEGVGERLTRLKSMPGVWIVMAKPPVPVSTADIFNAFDSAPAAPRPDIDKLLSCIDREELSDICAHMKNTLEPVAISMYPIIAELKKFFLAQEGALGAIMSGSGPTVFCVFADRTLAESSRNAARKHFPAINDIFLTRTFSIY